MLLKDIELYLIEEDFVFSNEMKRNVLYTFKSYIKYNVTENTTVTIFINYNHVTGCMVSIKGIILDTTQDENVETPSDTADELKFINSTSLHDVKAYVKDLYDRCEELNVQIEGNEHHASVHTEL